MSVGPPPRQFSRFVAPAGFVFVCACIVAFSVSACDGADGTPQLRLGSAGLRNDILVSADATAPEHRRVRSTDEVLLVATASDVEAGVRSVRLNGALRVTCAPRTGTNIVRIQEPIAEAAAATDETARPKQLAKQFALRVPAQRDRCPSGTKFLDLQLRLRAEAETGSVALATPEVVVESFGPDSVRVASFNFFNPGNHTDDVFRRWGEDLISQADVAFFQELPDERRAQLVASAAGLPYVGYLENTAIASRAPIRDLVLRETTGGIIISGVTDLQGHPHQIIGVHFTPKGPDGRVAEPQHSSSLRVEASERLLELLRPPPQIVIVGGDFNAYSGIGPQEAEGSTPEITMLSAAMTDVYAALGLPDDAHCGKRIDYIFVRGPYIPAEYKAPCEVGSDHPFVWARLDVE